MIVTLVISILVGIMLCNIMYNLYCTNNKDNSILKSLIYCGKISFVFYFLVILSNCIICMLHINDMNIFETIYSYVIISFTIGMSSIDIKLKLLPTKLIKIFVLVWFGISSVYLIYSLDIATQYIFKCLLGALFGFITFMFTYIVSGKKLGGGDIRLATIMGLFLTSDRILVALLFGTLMSALYSLIMMILKKLKPKDSIPLCPFLCVGTIISLLS